MPALSVELFPFAQHWWVYGVFTLFVIGVLALDLGVFHRRPRRVSFRESAAWTGFWVSLALLFNCALYYYAVWSFQRDPRLAGVIDPHDAAWRVSLEFLAGYLVEESLSVDNIFVFVLVFQFFGIPARYQHRVLFYGILGAIVFRAIFIAVGAALMDMQWVVIGFGVFLLYSAYRMIRMSGETLHPDRNPVLRLLERFMPVKRELDGPNFFTRIDGRLAATPLLVALLFLETTDIVFAADSVPAIFGLTREPLIVFTSNIFAILGLRSLYFLLAGALDRFYLLRYGLALVLAFVGLKMSLLNAWFDGHFPIGWSLGIIAGLLVASIACSLLFPRQATESLAHRG